MNCLNGSLTPLLLVLRDILSRFQVVLNTSVPSSPNKQTNIHVFYSHMFIAPQEEASLKGAISISTRSEGLYTKSLTKIFKFDFCNPCKSSPSLTILVTLWFIIICLVFFYLCKLLFSDFFQFKGNFVRSRNNSK